MAFRRPNSALYEGQVEWDSTSLSDGILTNGEWAAVAIATKGENGLLGWLSQEYLLPTESLKA